MRDLRWPAFALAGFLLLVCFGLLHTWFWSRHVIVDTPIYEQYGIAMRQGQLPYRDFAVEYPPGALPAFVAPTFAGDYASTFGWLMAVCGVAILFVLALARARPAVLLLVGVSPLLIGSMLLSRFDLWPTLFVVIALCALARDRHRIGWLALGLAIAIKVFAFVLVPLAAVWTLRRRGRRELAVAAAIAVAALVAVFAPFVAVAPRGVWHSVWGQASRPLQIESLGATVLRTFGHPTIVATHGSLNIAGKGWLATLTTLVELAVLVAIWAGFARGPAEPERLVRYSAAALCAFIAFGKVISPQFLIWLVPIVPLVRGRRGLAATALLVAVLFTTQVYFPARYFPFVYDGHLAWVVLLRDVLLVALLAVLSLPARERARSA